MKIAVYSPYLDTFGGGERYMLTIADELSKDHQVDLLLNKSLQKKVDRNFIGQIGKYFSLNLSNVNLELSPLGKGTNSFQRLSFFRNYDVLFFLTDGSLFFSSSKNNIVHFQVPFKNPQGNKLLNRLKISSWQIALCNSHFTATHLLNWGFKKVKVVYPPVQVDLFKPLKKEKIILSVGRFDGFLKAKKHEEMIKVFISLSESNQMKDWTLCLVGSAQSGDDVYIKQLQRLTGGSKIKFLPNLPFDKLTDLYGQASLYWHAAGFEEEDPTKFEHFGIATVEAMAAGAIPIVINKGGQTEIVEDGKNGFLWDSLEELKNYTLRVIKDEKLIKNLSTKAIEKSKNFSDERFRKEIRGLL